MKSKNAVRNDMFTISNGRKSFDATCETNVMSDNEQQWLFPCLENEAGFSKLIHEEVEGFMDGEFVSVTHKKTEKTVCLIKKASFGKVDDLVNRMINECCIFLGIPTHA